MQAPSGESICLVTFVPGETATDRDRIGRCAFRFTGADGPKPGVALRLSQRPVGAAAACRRRAGTIDRALAGERARL